MRAFAIAHHRMPARGRGVAVVLVAALASLFAIVPAGTAAAAPSGMIDPVTVAVAGTPSSVDTTVAANCGSGFNGGGQPGCGSPVTMQYGQGEQLQLLGYTANGLDYQVLPTSGADVYTHALRVDNPQVSGERHTIWIANAPAGDRLTGVSSNPSGKTMGGVLSSAFITEGSDNTFANQSGVTFNNIERLSILRTEPLAASNPSNVAIAVVERGGNDAFTIAAVTAVDAQGAPTAWGPIVNVSADAWEPIVTVTSTVQQRLPGETDYRPLDYTSAQPVSGVSITLADLGLAAGEYVYGVSIVGSDETSMNPGSWNTTTDGTAGGLDLVSAVFSTAIQPTAEDETSTGTQGASQTMVLSGQAGDMVVPLVPEATRLEAPAGGSVSPDGTVVDVPGEGQYVLDRQTQQVEFTPEPTFVGEATPVDYVVTDEAGTTASATLTPTVTPVAQPDESTGPQGVPQVIDASANDDGSSVTTVADTIRFVDPATGEDTDTIEVDGEGTWTIDDQDELVFTPEPEFVGDATEISYRIDTEDGDTVQSTVQVTVTAVAPVAEDDASTGVQGVAQSVDPLVNDAAGDVQVPLDEDSLTLLDGDGEPVESVTVAGGVYTVVDGRIVFTPEPTFTGVAPSVDYRVADANGTPAEATYTPTVTAVAPVAEDDASTGVQGVAQSVDPLVNDAPGNAQVPLDEDSLTLLDGDGEPVESVTVAGGEYTVVDGRIVFTPESTFTGVAPSVDYRVVDANGTPAEATYTPTVTAVAPVAANDASESVQGAEQRIDPFDNDTPGDVQVPLDRGSLTLLNGVDEPTTSIVVEGVGEWSVDGDELVFQPEPGYSGVPDPVEYRIADDNGTTTTAWWSTEVSAGVTPDASSGPQGVEQAIDVPANDDDDVVPQTVQIVDPATGELVSSLTVPGEGIYEVQDNGEITFTPEPQFHGPATPITYDIEDEDGNHRRSVVTVTVEQVTPVAENDASTGVQGAVQSVNPLANDVPGNAQVPLDVDSLTLLDGEGEPVASVTVAGGVYTVVDGRIVFTPEPTFTGVAPSVDYWVADANGTPAEATYTPTVTPGTVEQVADDVIEAEVGDPVTFDPVKEVPGLIPGTVTIIDPDGEPTTSLVVDGEGRWDVDPETGEVTFTPEPGLEGDPTPVTWTGTTVDGVPVTGQLTVEYIAEEELSSTGVDTSAVMAMVMAALALIAAGGAMVIGTRRGHLPRA